MSWRKPSWLSFAAGTERMSDISLLLPAVAALVMGFAAILYFRHQSHVLDRNYGPDPK